MTTIRRVARQAVAVASLLALPSLASAEGEGYYTEEQARRGKIAFTKYCTLCHTVDTKTPVAEQIKDGRGYRLGMQPSRGLLNLGGRYLWSEFEGRPKYPSVYYLFTRIRQSMPGYGADTIGNDVKVNIIAYLLQANGLSPGKKELTTDVPAMKTMRINAPKPPDETGFVPIFNGKDFTGWNFMLGPNCRQAPEGCGKNNPSGGFRIDDGKLICTCKIQGYAYTEKKYQNFTWRFDYRYVPPPDWTDDDGVVYPGRGGYFLFVNDHRVWPKAIQINQYFAHHVLIPENMDTKLKWTEEPGAVEKSRRPLGAWNSVEIVSKDGKVYSYHNGILVSTVTDHEFKQPGSIAIQAEGAEMEFRNLRIKAE